ncbi:zincin [Aspergillus sclerotiicarbonarius CBS 121057]|uniref:Zincin n=1 Tax=Aspergillus sclerotiicarbonarius (strain CBS 121057 / IBT 28362) TaxID=1448318 RepID=A0A319F685_ASPSB|nr:zincin [Aspergillus sclerotiicarbonarius CBS 121057]
MCLKDGIVSCVERYSRDEEQAPPNHPDEEQVALSDSEPELLPRPQELALKRHRWKPGSKLNVRFLPASESIEGTMDVEDSVKKKVEQAANIWTQHANICFVFDQPGDAEIRIRFAKGSCGGESFIGMDIPTHFTQNDHTMLIRPGSNTIFEPSLQAVVLHEFGHALGAVHEHQNPNPKAKIKWKKNVYEYYETWHGFSKTQVDTQILEKFNLDDFNVCSPLDTKSIMIYPIDIRINDSSIHSVWPENLSRVDIDYIGRAYPMGSNAGDGGFFSFDLTSLNRIYNLVKKKIKGAPKGVPVPLQSAMFSYSKFKDLPPNVAVGLCGFRFEGENLHVRVGAKRVGTNHFDIEATGEGDFDTVWFAPNNPDLQVGSYSTWGDEGTPRPIKKCDIPVKFDKKFDSRPLVIVWLQDFELTPPKDKGVRTTAVKVTTDGYTLQIRSCGNSDLRDVSVSWIACPQRFSIDMGICRFQSGSQGTELEEMLQKDYDMPITAAYYAVSSFEFDSKGDGKDEPLLFNVELQKEKKSFLAKASNGFRSAEVSYLILLGGTEDT